MARCGGAGDRTFDVIEYEFQVNSSLMIVILQIYDRIFHKICVIIKTVFAKLQTIYSEKPLWLCILANNHVKQGLQPAGSVLYSKGICSLLDESFASSCLPNDLTCWWDIKPQLNYFQL